MLYLVLYENNISIDIKIVWRLIIGKFGIVNSNFSNYYSLNYFNESVINWDLVEVTKGQINY